MQNIYIFPRIRQRMRAGKKKRKNMRSRKAETEVSAALKKAAAAGAETVRVYCAPDGGGKTEAVLRIGNLPRAEIRHGRIMFAVPKGGFSGRTAAELERAGLPGDRLFPENITEISYGGRTLYPQKQ